MYVTSDLALCLVDQAANSQREADNLLRSAIRQALACNAPVEHIATRAKRSIEQVLTMVGEQR